MMEDGQRRIVAGGTIILLLGAGAWWYTSHPSPVIPIVPTDQITSWNFKGLYADGGELEKRARDEITRLKGLLGTKEFPKYELLISISQQYALLGEGKLAYEYLDKALQLDKTTGLAYSNLGDLLVRVGAYETARNAYARAVELEHGQLIYHRLYIAFLIEHFPNDTTAIHDAFNEAYIIFDDVSELLSMKADWLIATKDIEGAIGVLIELKNMKSTSLRERGNIEARIQALRAEQ